jgi:threonine aldolase
MLTDGELAVQKWTNQLHQSSTNLHDHKMALSMAQAVRDDGVALALAAQGENRVFADRRLAFQLARS